TAPMVKMPDILRRSVSSAKNQLLSNGLVAGDIEYIAALEENSIMKIKVDGREITPGSAVPKGSKVTLVVGDGLGDQMIEVPNLIGMASDEAEILVSGQNLSISIHYVGAVDGSADGTIVRQRPAASGNKIRAGDVIDVDVAGTDPNAPN
ncbi:MAG TPA: PASTA domain-containing protein, partial [Emticicia sp.]